jgi:hypothetical protein
VLRSDAETTSVYSQVVALGTRPSSAPGHSFFVNFSLGDKPAQLITTQYDPAAIGALQDGVAGVTAGTPAARPPQTRLTVGGTIVKSSAKAVFDRTRNTVVVTIPTAELAAALPGFAPGAVLTKVVGRTSAQTPGDRAVQRQHRQGQRRRVHGR